MKMLAVLAVTLFAQFASAQSTGRVTGLVCDYEAGAQEIKVSIDVTVDGRQATLVFREGNNLTGSGRFVTTATAVSPILREKLAEMDGVTLTDATNRKYTLSFHVDGQTFDRKPRLGIVSKSGKEKSEFYNCGVQRSGRYKALASGSDRGRSSGSGRGR